MTQTKPLSRAERQRIQLRKDIIDAAMAEFSARGYHQTSIADIAQRLGIGHGTFYRYFKNKRDILEHVINDVAQRITAALVDDNAPTAVKTLDDYREQTLRIGKRLMAMVAEEPQVLRLLLFEATSIDPEMSARISGFFDWSAKLVPAYMENGVKAGIFREDLDTEVTSQAVIALILTGAVNVLRNPEDKALQKRMADAVLKLLVSGIARR